MTAVCRISGRIPGILVACSLALTIFFNQQAHAKDKVLKGELEHLLSDKTMVSKIIFGGKGTPREYQMDYPVNTLVYPDSGGVTYRVEWGVMRTEIGTQEMLRSFDRGTSFHVSGIDLKDDRLELKLKSGSGDSAKLKLMLGAGWQSKFDSSSVQAQLARVFVFDQQPQPTQGTTVAGGSIAPSAPVSAASMNEYQRDPNAPKIEGRVSEDDFRTVMAAFDEEVRSALSTLSQDAAILSRSLLAYQRAYKGNSDNASQPQLQAISRLQDRLGKSIQPQRDDDVIEMNEVFKRCVRLAQLGQARDEQGHLYGAGRDSESFQRLLLSDSAVDVSGKVQKDVEAERAQRAIIDRARTAVISVEQSLDKGDLIEANRQYRQMLSDAQTAEVRPLLQYLQRTAAFRQDLASYAQATRLDRRRETSGDAGTPANQRPVPPNSAVNSEQPESASQVSTRAAYVDCKALKQLELYPTPEASSSPVVVLQCGEKVMAIGEQDGWVKVRTEQNVEGYLSHYFLRYDEPPSLGQSPAEQPAGPEGQPDSSPVAVPPSPDENVQQSPPPQATEQRPATSTPPVEPASGADDSWSWYQYALAFILPLAAVVLLIGLAVRAGRGEALHFSIGDVMETMGEGILTLVQWVVLAGFVILLIAVFQWLAVLILGPARGGRGRRKD